MVTNLGPGQGKIVTISVFYCKLFSVKNAANHIRSDVVVVERVRRVFGPARPPHRIGTELPILLRE